VTAPLAPDVVKLDAVTISSHTKPTALQLLTVARIESNDASLSSFSMAEPGRNQAVASLRWRVFFLIPSVSLDSGQKSISGEDEFDKHISPFSDCSANENISFPLERFDLHECTTTDLVINFRRKDLLRSH
jgi:hypothetical protein